MLWLAVLIYVLANIANPASATVLSTEQKLYLQTIDDIRNHHVDVAKNSMRQLVNYPLYPYLEYNLYQTDFTLIKQQDILQFAEKYPNSPLNNSLRANWLLFLAKKQRWQDYVNYYPANITGNAKTILQCNYLWANIQLNQYDMIKNQIAELWLTAVEWPKTCEQVIDFWIRNNDLTYQILWQKIYLAADARQPKLLKSLGTHLPKREQKLIDQWLILNKNPKNHTEKLDTKQYFTNYIVVNWIKRYFDQDEQELLQKWPSLIKNYQPSPYILSLLK